MTKTELKTLILEAKDEILRRHWDALRGAADDSLGVKSFVDSIGSLEDAKHILEVAIERRTTEVE